MYSARNLSLTTFDNLSNKGGPTSSEQVSEVIISVNKSSGSFELVLSQPHHVDL